MTKKEETKKTPKKPEVKKSCALICDACLTQLHPELPNCPNNMCRKPRCISCSE